MLTLNTKIDSATTIDDELILPFDQREKSRLRAKLSSGADVAVFTVRGTILRDGDLLQGSDTAGKMQVVKIVAAKEATYRVDCDTPRTLLRCAFHLGNRHTQAHVDAGFLRIRKDSVLKDMLEGLGASVTEELAGFEPESGAYGANGSHGGGHHHEHHPHNPLAPVPLRQRIHRPAQIENKSPSDSE